jgi:ATP-binding cassette subfamily B protein
MKTGFTEILVAVKRVIGLLTPKEKRSLYIANFLMVITGILTNGPAVILGKLVDRLVGGTVGASGCGALIRRRPAWDFKRGARR